MPIWNKDVVFRYALKCLSTLSSVTFQEGLARSRLPGNSCYPACHSYSVSSGSNTFYIICLRTNCSSKLVLMVQFLCAFALCQSQPFLFSRSGSSCCKSSLSSCWCNLGRNKSNRIYSWCRRNSISSHSLSNGFWCSGNCWSLSFVPLKFSAIFHQSHVFLINVSWVLICFDVYKNA